MSREDFKGAGEPNATLSSRLSDDIVLGNLAVMLKQERSRYYCPCFDYLSIYRDLQPSNEHVNENWRRKICEWAFEVVDHYGFDREVVSIALNYVDRMVAHKTKASKARVPRKEFQLIAVTSLYLAIKLHGETDAVEGAPRKLRINAFVELSRGMFTIESFETMERAFLSSLEWHVNPPTTVAFIASLLRLLPASWDGKPIQPSVASSIFHMARYLTELSVCVSTFSFHFKTSEISYSAILCAIDALRDSVPLPYKARISFLNRIAQSTSLTPGAGTIRQCCGMIMELCPSLFIEPDDAEPKRKKQRQSSSSCMFADDGLPMPEPSGSLSRNTSVASEGGGSCSPVCVSEQIEEEEEVAQESVTRKRPRPQISTTRN